MIVLGRVKTQLGAVELDYGSGIFTTSGTYADAITGETRESIIVVGEESAREWFDYCAERGAVFGEFPEAVGS